MVNFFGNTYPFGDFYPNTSYPTFDKMAESIVFILSRVLWALEVRPTSLLCDAGHLADNWMSIEYSLKLTLYKDLRKCWDNHIRIKSFIERKLEKPRVNARQGVNNDIIAMVLRENELTIGQAFDRDLGIQDSKIAPIVIVLRDTLNKLQPGIKYQPWQFTTALTKTWTTPIDERLKEALITELISDWNTLQIIIKNEPNGWLNKAIFGPKRKRKKRNKVNCHANRTPLIQPLV